MTDSDLPPNYPSIVADILREGDRDFETGRQAGRLEGLLIGAIVAAFGLVAYMLIWRLVRG
jgi:hypothetical protein